MNKHCPICKAELKPDDKYYMVASDNPYFNIFVHFDCYNTVKDNLYEYITTHFAEFVKEWAKNKKK